MAVTAFLQPIGVPLTTVPAMPAGLVHYICSTEAERPTGQIGDIAYTIDTAKSWRWTGSAWASMAGAGGGGAAWGEITGTIGDQTDLVAALNATHDIITAHTGFPGGTGTFLRADGTFAAAGGAGASATRVVVTAAFPAARNKRVNVVDAAVGVNSRVMVWVSGIADGLANAGDLVDLHASRAIAKAGSFDLDLDFLTPWAGSLSIDYVVFS